MNDPLTLEYLLKHSERLYPDTTLPLLKWNASIERNVSLLFRINHVIDARRERSEYIAGLANFVDAFNEFCGDPFEFNLKETFGNWPVTPFEEWAESAHTRFLLNSSLHRKYDTFRYTITIEVGGIVDIDLLRYIKEYDQATIMTKMSRED